MTESLGNGSSARPSQSLQFMNLTYKHVRPDRRGLLEADYMRLVVVEADYMLTGHSADWA
jgi:hypothetical protein